MWEPWFLESEHIQWRRAGEGYDLRPRPGHEAAFHELAVKIKHDDVEVIAEHKESETRNGYIDCLVVKH